MLRVCQHLDGVGVEWQIFPTGGQHFNGQAERMIGLVKSCLDQSMIGKRCSLGELNTITAEAVQIVNSGPVARNTGNPKSGGPITQLHLMLGRASIAVPQMKFEESSQLTWRLQFIEETKKQFWEKWMQQVFKGRVLCHGCR
jgi:hypothetical protein